MSTDVQKQNAEELVDEFDRLLEREDELVHSRITWMLLANAFILFCGFALFRLRSLAEIASDLGAWLVVAVLATGYLALQARSYYRTASETSRRVREVRDSLRSALTQ